eukprot:gnl/MRDRNA2_/MRDRNA2_116049_c0_seq1.p1 gnl/MRDRNA2_/MRDRNA2_116049_c0~~gnl/MRDRNA2_/MRDRNA2_116049_c0_seq1.p1  ORF type:complete len:508 (-),score=113.90 gnl/MRDRNA2_/MRDRNA2_116049_c0_seq1:45-1568(-)
MSLAFDKSREWYERSQKSIAGGVNSNGRKFPELQHPIFFTNGQGSKLTDVDGNEYIDYILGLGPQIFGHSPPFLLHAVSEEMFKGQMFAAPTVLETELAEAVKKIVPCAEMVRFSSSGTEAVQAAVRVARAFTGKSIIVKFEGHYHGWGDNVLFNTAAKLDASGPPTSPHAVPMSTGMPSSLGSDVLVLPWNDIDSVKKAFKERGREIAAVLTEPVMCNTNCILPQEGYLQALRDLCTSNKALLIFDEVITGFRLDAGGAQKFFGITPDLATFAKAMAGGFPISMLAGKREMMEMIATGAVVHQGTANGNIMSVAAGIASLKRLTDPQIGTIKRLHEMGEKVMAGFREVNEKFGAGMSVQGPGPCFTVQFTNGLPITDYRSHVRNSDPQKLGQFVNAMLKRGVRIKSGIWFMSEAHTDEDVEATIKAAAESLEEMSKNTNGVPHNLSPVTKAHKLHDAHHLHSLSISQHLKLFTKKASSNVNMPTAVLIAFFVGSGVTFTMLRSRRM